jgi:hypothetical protein
VVKYRRHRLVFAKTDMKPAAAGEPRSPPGARTRGTLTSRAWVLPRPRSIGRCPAPSSRPADQRLRRDTTTWRLPPQEPGAENSAPGLHILPRRGNCHAFTAKGSPDLHYAKQSCLGTLGRTKRSAACRCHAVDPFVFLSRTIIPLFRERPAARGCFAAFLPLQPVSHRRRSREAGGRFPYRCRI